MDDAAQDEAGTSRSYGAGEEARGPIHLIALRPYVSGFLFSRFYTVLCETHISHMGPGHLSYYTRV